MSLQRLGSLHGRRSGIVSTRYEETAQAEPPISIPPRNPSQLARSRSVWSLATVASSSTGSGPASQSSACTTPTTPCVPCVRPTSLLMVPAVPLVAPPVEQHPALRCAIRPIAEEANAPDKEPTRESIYSMSSAKTASMASTAASIAASSLAGTTTTAATTVTRPDKASTLPVSAPAPASPVALKTWHLCLGRKKSKSQRHSMLGVFESGSTGQAPAEAVLPGATTQDWHDPTLQCPKRTKSRAAWALPLMDSLVSRRNASKKANCAPVVTSAPRIIAPLSPNTSSPAPSPASHPSSLLSFPPPTPPASSQPASSSSSFQRVLSMSDARRPQALSSGNSSGSKNSGSSNSGQRADTIGSEFGASFVPIRTPIPSEALIEDDVLTSLSFSRRGSLMLLDHRPSVLGRRSKRMSEAETGVAGAGAAGVVVEAAAPAAVRAAKRDAVRVPAIAEKEAPAAIPTAPAPTILVDTPECQPRPRPLSASVERESHRVRSLYAAGDLRWEQGSSFSAATSVFAAAAAASAASAATAAAASAATAQRLSNPPRPCTHPQPKTRGFDDDVPCVPSAPDASRSERHKQLAYEYGHHPLPISARPVCEAVV